MPLSDARTYWYQVYCKAQTPVLQVQYALTLSLGPYLYLIACRLKYHGDWLMLWVRLH